MRFLRSLRLRSFLAIPLFSLLVLIALSAWLTWPTAARAGFGWRAWLRAAPAPPAPLMFNTITVTSTSGGTGGPGCTLRDAIEAANTDLPQGGCSAGGGADVIVLPANATITLTMGVYQSVPAIFDNGLPVITSQITIQGNNATITRDGAAPRFRFFQVEGTGDLTLDNVTLSNGRAGLGTDDDGGGAIHNNGGRVTLQNSTFVDNQADGDDNDGGVYESEHTASVLTVNNCLFQNNSAGDDGGVMDNYEGMFTITNSYFLNNRAGLVNGGGLAGAIRDFSDLPFTNTITACTFQGNSAPLGGAVVQYGVSTLNILNSTFNGNSATVRGGAVYQENDDGEVNLTHCTVVGNTAPTAGGLDDFDGDMYLFNTIIANNTGGVNCLEGDDIIAGADNLEFPGAATCDAATIGDPVLGPLQYNGGPVVGAAGSAVGLPTMMPAMNSPALNVADAGFSLPTDQRGAARPFGVGPDIGAVEAGALVPTLPTISIADPGNCFDPGGVVGILATVTNNSAAPLPATFTATLPGDLTAIAGTCTTSLNPGGCTIAANGGSVTWNGQLGANQTVTIVYRARLGPNVGNGSQICWDNAAVVGGLTANLRYCFTINCPLANTRVSDQKAGSVLVFPYYTSTIGGGSDTRMTITNVSNAASVAANQTYVHLFFIDGTTCAQADLFLCLTPNASFSFKASEYDPGNTGYLLAVAVDRQGLPIQNNVLIGNAFVTTPQFADNYGAESFWANSFAVASVSGNTATLYFDQVGYDPVPRQFAVEIQSPVDAAGQQIVTAGLSGDLTTSQITGAAQVGTGQAFNEKEAFASFNGWLTGTCQARATIATNSPRVPNGLGNLIKTGQAGTLKFNVGAAVGLLLTPRTATWKGIRTLHKTQTTTAALTIPIFVPVC